MTKDLSITRRRGIDIKIKTVYRNFKFDKNQEYQGFEGIIAKALSLDPVYIVDKNGEDQSYCIICFEKLDLGSQIIEEDIADYLSRYSVIEAKGLSPYHLGILGFRKYEYSRKLFRDTGISETQEPSSGFMLGKLLMVLDRQEKSYQIIYNISDLEISMDEAYLSIEKLNERLLSSSNNIEITPTEDNYQAPITFVENRSKDEFIKKVEDVKEHIRRGDIFQGVLSQKFYAKGQLDLKKTYLTLRRLHTSLYLNYINFGDAILLSASPETLVNTVDGKVTTYPIAGTRGVKNDGRDDERAKELKNNIKENAEHLMLVDLGRNDLSRVCKSGTVRVVEYSKVKKLTNVMHLVSCIEGELKDEKEVFAAIDSAFPAGTLSGAPKQRAIQILKNLEGDDRGYYGGATVVIDCYGNLDSSINIRSIVCEKGYIAVQGGAGIVYDSIPELEYKEIINKTKGIFNVIESSYEGEIIYDFGDR